MGGLGIQYADDAEPDGCEGSDFWLVEGSCFQIRLSQNRGGLTRHVINVKSESMNPKDPPSIELCALLDTGANCNVISKRYEHLFNVSGTSKRRIRFATEDNSQLASIRKGKFSIEYQELNIEFEAEFYSCDIVEDVILGNPFLKRTGTQRQRSL